LATSQRHHEPKDWQVGEGKRAKGGRGHQGDGGREEVGSQSLHNGVVAPARRKSL